MTKEGAQSHTFSECVKSQNSNVINQQKAHADNIYEFYKSSTVSDINGLIKENTTMLNFSNRITSKQFPKIDAHIFLSHSHLDQIETLNVASWLQHNFQLTSFIDSEVWRHIDQLAENNQDKIILKKCLNNALKEMINHTECFIFIESVNSSLKIDGNNYTSSKWIMEEIRNSRINQRPKEDHRVMLKKSTLITCSNSSRPVLQPIKIDHLVQLDANLLSNWIWATFLHSTPTSAFSSLDHLYSLK